MDDDYTHTHTHTNQVSSHRTTKHTNQPTTQAFTGFHNSSKFGQDTASPYLGDDLSVRGNGVFGASGESLSHAQNAGWVFVHRIGSGVQREGRELGLWSPGDADTLPCPLNNNLCFPGMFGPPSGGSGGGIGMSASSSSSGSTYGVSPYSTSPLSTSGGVGYLYQVMARKEAKTTTLVGWLLGVSVGEVGALCAARWMEGVSSWGDGWMGEWLAPLPDEVKGGGGDEWVCRWMDGPPNLDACLPNATPQHQHDRERQGLRLHRSDSQNRNLGGGSTQPPAAASGGIPRTR